MTANLSTTATAEAQLGIGPASNYKGNLVPLSIGATYEENPTISYTPVQGERYAKSFRRWREVEALDTPLVLLIGGATGVGKSTIATQLAARLGIVRVVATDAVREVMRALFSRELMPTLYTSSFQADEALREPPTRDAVVVGFREQTAAVAVGIDALLQRAAVEGTSIVIEGAHVVPGFMDLESRSDRILAVPLIITVEDEDVHRSHFLTRSADHGGRPAPHYLKSFENIRKTQRYIKSQALQHGVPVIPNYDFDRTLAAVVGLVMERVTERAPHSGVAGTTPFAEEVLLRGVTYARLRETWGDASALLVSAGLFSLMHLNAANFVPFMVVGAVFALLMRQTRSLWTAILGHSLFNLVGVIVLLAVKTQGAG